MRIYYKKETNLTRDLESTQDITLYKKPGWLENIGFKTIIYPDIYFHTGVINNFSKTLIQNSKITIVNSSILQDILVETLNIDKDKVKVIFPAVEIVDFKKKEIKKPFYQTHSIDKDKKIIYFTAKNFKKSGFENYCDILTKIERTNYKAVITITEDSEKIYVQDVLAQYKLEDDVLIVEEEIFEIADIFLLPTTYSNFSINILKAMASKCVAFVPENNYAVELVDVFSIMKEKNDLNTAYKIDMVLRINSELKKIQKNNYNLAKKLDFSYQKRKLDQIIKELE